MMKGFKPYVFLVGAVIVALITSVAGYSYLQKGAAKQKAALPEKVSIAVAGGEILAGTVLSKEMLKKVYYFKESLPEGHFVDSTPLLGRVLIQSVKANEPILESRLAPIDVRTGGVTALISPKKRAVAVKVDKVIGVAGFIHAGNRVDVLVTVAPQREGQKGEPITKIVLENILVLASGAEFGQKKKDEKASQVDVITLEVAPEEAEKLALASTEGKLQLALRNPKDTEEVLTKGTTIPTLLASYSGNEAGKPVKTAFRRSETKPISTAGQSTTEKPKAFTVELIKGNKSSEVKVEGRE
jgi:pilus assembly protein CpaB